MISSMLGSNFGSQHPVMQAKHFETVFIAISSSFIIITSLVGEFFFVDWDSGCNELLRLHPESLMKSMTPRYCTPP